MTKTNDSGTLNDFGKEPEMVIPFLPGVFQARLKPVVVWGGQLASPEIQWVRAVW